MSVSQLVRRKWSSEQTVGLEEVGDEQFNSTDQI
jgi:hypothetical protein